MAGASATDASYSVYRLPDLDCSESDLLAYRDRYFNYDAMYRCRHMERMALNLHYYLGRQWMELDSDVLLDGVRGYIFRDARQTSEVEMPRPVTNYVASAVEVELASLGKRELTANVITQSRDPRIEAAAKKAKDILEHRLHVLNWDEAREMAAFLLVVCGTSVIKSYWDEPFTDLTRIGQVGAVACPACGTKLADRNVSADAEQLEGKYLAGSRPVKDDESQLKLDHCPNCTDKNVPLLPYAVGEDELDQSDMLGRPLGRYVPKGNTAFEVVSPFDIFPDNGGVDKTPENCRVWGQATVRDIEWVEERYPEFQGLIEREDPMELMRYHPLLGEWTLLGRYSSTLDSGIYDNHCRVFEIHSEKSLRFPEGRSIVLAGDRILENGVLYRTTTTATGETISAPRVQYSAARFKVRHGEFWGQALVDDLISPQNRLNGMDAQIIEARERMGSPNLMVSEAMDLSGPVYIEQYGSGKVMTYNSDPVNPGSKPEVFGGILMPEGVNQEREATIQDMTRVAGPQDVEIGEAPRNISTTSGLQLLGEQAERRRAPRERALYAMYEKLWSHQLRLIWAFRAETDEYEVENAEGEWETKQYDRMAILGQTKVQVEKQAFVDKSLYQREGTREAQADGLYILDNQAARKKILEYRGLPTDVNEGENHQVDVGKRQWVDFVEEGVIPVVDESIDDFQIRFQVLGTFLLSDEGKRLERAMDWPGILQKIAGWELELDMAEQQDQAAIAFYGGRLPPDQAAEAYAKATILFQEQSEAQAAAEQAAAQSAAAVGMPPNPPMPPPQPPPPPIFLPPAKQDRIYMVWKKLLSQNQAAPGVPGAAPTMAQQSPMPQAAPGGDMEPTAPLPQQPAVTPEQDAFLKFRAAVDAYRLLAKQAAMGMAMPAPAAPVAGGPPNPPNPMNPPNPPNPPNPGSPMS